MSIKNMSNWEKALAGHEQPTEEEWGEILRKADPETWEAYGEEDAACNAIVLFEEAAEKCSVGQLSLDFPQSTHGDGCNVSVYRLPQGTTVIVMGATWEVEDPRAVVLWSSDIERIVTEAQGLLFDGGDHGKIQNLDENPEYDEDVQVTYAGEARLREAWRRLAEKPDSDGAA